MTGCVKRGGSVCGLASLGFAVTGGAVDAGTRGLSCGGVAGGKRKGFVTGLVAVLALVLLLASFSAVNSLAQHGEAGVLEANAFALANRFGDAARFLNASVNDSAVDSIYAVYGCPPPVGGSFCGVAGDNGVFNATAYKYFLASAALFNESSFDLQVASPSTSCVQQVPAPAGFEQSFYVSIQARASLSSLNSSKGAVLNFTKYVDFDNDVGGNVNLKQVNVRDGSNKLFTLNVDCS